MWLLRLQFLRSLLHMHLWVPDVETVRLPKVSGNLLKRQQQRQTAAITDGFLLANHYQAWRADVTLGKCYSRATLASI